MRGWGQCLGKKWDGFSLFHHHRLHICAHTSQSLHVCFPRPCSLRQGLPEFRVPGAERVPIYCTAPASQQLWEVPGHRSYCLQSSLFSNTLRSRSWEKFCGHNMENDLLSSIHCGKEGVVERGPSSISHGVSVRLTSKLLRQTGVQHSR